MGWTTYLGFLAVALACAAFGRWYQPSVADQLARKTGLSGAKGWTALTVALAWMLLPLLAGATTDGELWMFGSAIAGVGFYVGVIAVTSVDEYRLLDRTRHVAPDRPTVGSGEEAVATSGTPSVEPGSEGEARTPFSGLPAVHTDWVLQRRERVGARRVWKSIGGGVRSVEFTLGDGAVAVTAGEHRVVSNAERIGTFEPDEPLPGAAAEFLRSRPDLPDPDERESRIRALETYVPADEPVTVVGIPEQGERPGQRLIDRAPPDDLLGTDGAHATDGSRAEAVLIRGDADEAERTLHKRVYWLGAAAVVTILGGQALAFWLSGAGSVALF